MTNNKQMGDIGDKRTFSHCSLDEIIGVTLRSVHTEELASGLCETQKLKYCQLTAIAEMLRIQDLIQCYLNCQSPRKSLSESCIKL